MVEQFVEVGCWFVVGDDVCVVVFCVVDQMVDDVELWMVLQWFEYVVFVEVVVYWYLFGDGSECVYDFVIYGVVYIEVFYGGVGLFGVDECVLEEVFCDG